MNSVIFRKLFFAMIGIGLIPMFIFSFITISSYQDLINKSIASGELNINMMAQSETNFENIITQVILIFILVTIFVVFFSILLARKFVLPIKRLTKGTEELKKGNFKSEIVLKSSDEFEILADSFNQMSGELQKKIDDLKKSELATHQALDNLTKVENNLEIEHKKTAAIISNFIDPIIVMDQENKINFFNPAAKDIFGLNQSALGRIIESKNNYSLENFRDIITTEYKIKKEKISNKSFCTLEEEMMINVKAQELTYKVITAPVLTEKRENLGVMKIFYNLTREKILDRMKSEFISIAAHQLRTPLAAIKWCIKLVLDGDEGELNAGQKELLNKGYISNERVIELVNDMLNVSRIEEGRLNYSFNQEDINNALQIVLGSLEKRIQDKKINLIINKDESLPLVLMDKDKIILVLQNLLENAVKYTPENGKIELSITADKSKIIIRVKDNGLGIPKDDQKKLFSKFFRAQNVIRIQTEGSGLGLFICKNIIESHGGKINFTSEEGIGTEFILNLPVGKNKSKDIAGVKKI